MQYLYRNLLNLRRIAIQNRLSDDPELYIEKCYRYYSKTYSMSLEQVKKDLAPEEVMLIYMEDELVDTDVEEILRIKALLDNTEKPVLNGYIEDNESTDMSDDEWIAQQNALLKKEEDTKKMKQQEDIAKKTHEVIEQLTQSFKSLTNTYG